MIKLYVDKESTNARKYTDTFYEYLLETGHQENDITLDLLYWLSDDEVKRFAEFRDIEFVEDLDELED